MEQQRSNYQQQQQQQLQIHDGSTGQKISKVLASCSDYMKYDFKEGLYLSPAQTNYLLPHFFMIIVGKPGSGKTSVMRHMLMNEQFYKNTFDRVLLISPSAGKVGLPLAKTNTKSLFDVDWLFQKIAEINMKQFKKLTELLRLSENEDILLAPRNCGRDASLGDLYRAQDLSKKKEFMKMEHMFNKTPLKNSFFGDVLINHMEMKRSELESTKKVFDGPAAKRKGNGRTKRISKGNAISSLRNKKGAPTVPFVAGKRREIVTNARQGELMGDVMLASGKYQMIDFVNVMAEQWRTLKPETQEKHHFNMLIVLDDVIGYIKDQEHSPFVAQLFFNRRHLISNGTISIMLISQKYTMIPARLRSNANWLLLFRLNPVDFENVFKDVIPMRRQLWEYILYAVYGRDEELLSLENNEARFNNLGIWVEKDIYFKNFVRLITN